eukprot:765957-Hanusia_phi.AAC.12
MSGQASRTDEILEQRSGGEKGGEVRTDETVRWKRRGFPRKGKEIQKGNIETLCEQPGTR